MSIRIPCPNPECEAVVRVEEESLGRRGRCKRCGQVFALARPDGEAASAMSGDASFWKDPSSPLPAAGPTDLPEQFGRYRILRSLGRGGMGAVYLAVDTKLDRRVALKVPYFHPADGPEAIRRFEREARAAATLDHANLCPILDIGEVNGIQFLTMPYIEGKTLSQVIEQERTFSEAKAAAVVRKLALATQEAHAKGIIHRDLKPTNIMFKRGRELVIMDFGLARMAGGEESLTRTGSILGTALYMAPEQANGEIAEIGPASDVYSLGVILHELLAGCRPFEGPWALVIGLKSVKDPDPPSRHRPDLSPLMDAICLKAIARKPDDRYASMTDFAAALGDFLAGTTSPAPSSTAAASRSAPPPRETPAEEAALAFAGLIIQDATSLRGESFAARTKPDRPTGDGRRSPSPAQMIVAGVAALLIGLVAHLATGLGRVEPRVRVEDEAKPRERSDVHPPPMPKISARPGVPADARRLGSKRYKVFRGGSSWHEAKSRCEAMGGHLAIVTSREENDFLAGLMRRGGVVHAWIGLSDEGQEGRWRWVDGSEVDYEAWDRGRNQPNNGSHNGIPENYVLMALPADGLWWDVLDDAEGLAAPTGYLCQWDP